MGTGRSEAFDLLSKWVSERTLLECTMSFPLFTSHFRVRLDEVRGDELRLVSDDTTSELALRISSWTEFGYGDMGRVEVPEQSGDTLVFFFRFGKDDESDDFISLTALGV